MAAISITQSG